MNYEDLQRAYLLLEIIEKCAGHTGRFSAISNATMTELAALNDTIRAEAMAAEQVRRDSTERQFVDQTDAEHANESGESLTAADPIRRL